MNCLQKMTSLILIFFKHLAFTISPIATFLFINISLLSFNCAEATSLQRLNPGAFVRIDVPWTSPGYGIQNNSSNSVLIPYKSQGEFDSFTSAASHLNISICRVQNGGWTGFTPQGSCSVSCGGGTQTETRSCTNPAPSCGGDSCSGATQQQVSCNTQACAPTPPPPPPPTPTPPPPSGPTPTGREFAVCKWEKTVIKNGASYKIGGSALAYKDGSTYTIRVKAYAAFAGSCGSNFVTGSSATCSSSFMNDYAHATGSITSTGVAGNGSAGKGGSISFAYGASGNCTGTWQPEYTCTGACAAPDS